MVESPNVCADHPSVTSTYAPASALRSTRYPFQMSSNVEPLVGLLQTSTGSWNRASVVDGFAGISVAAAELSPTLIERRPISHSRRLWRKIKAGRSVSHVARTMDTSNY